jgi:hypothetical protein
MARFSLGLLRFEIPPGAIGHSQEGQIMMRFVCVLTVAVLVVASSAFAIDRDARFIDTVSLETTRYDGGDSLGGSLWAETATAAKSGDWAVLCGGGLGELWPDGGDSILYWEVGLGLKHYLAVDTSISVLGTYRELDIQDRPDILTGLGFVKHRLVPPDDDISPYIIAGAGLRQVEYIPEPPVDDDFTELLIFGGLGCDFMMAKNFAIVFESVWYRTEELDDDETADWWQGRVGMQYYWDER